MGKYADMFRKICTKGDAERDQGLTTPEDIERFDDIQYDTIEPKWQMLDVYRPKNEKGKKLPVIMIVHGGGWVYGDKEVYQFYGMHLAQHGFAVVNYSYRLAPEYKYPASFEDSCTVMKWVQDNAEKYGLDTEHIFAVGDSAGGHMLSLMTVAMTNPSYKADFTIPEGFKFKAVALNCGKYIVKETKDDGSGMNPMEEFLPNGGTKEERDHISSALYVTDKFLPSFIMTCPGDFLYTAPEELIPHLKENGVPFVYRVYGNKENPLAHVFHCNIRLKEAIICNDEECAFFKEFC